MDNATNIARMERQRLPAEQGVSMSANEEAARLNRYSLAMNRLETATPRAIGGQMLDALEATDNQFDLFLADAIKRSDEKLIGKLVIAALQKHRHRIADEEASV
jgi:Cu/Ag efflux pump CusA